MFNEQYIFISLLFALLYLLLFVIFYNKCYIVDILKLPFIYSKLNKTIVDTRLCPFAQLTMIT